jgi:hypothetical protein
MLTLARIALSVAAISASGICLALTPTLTTAIENPVRPIVTGQTNLPDGTQLLLTISRAESRFEAQSKVKVVKGGFRSEQFSQKGADLNPGKYKLEIVMPVAAVQTPEVRAVIGTNGEKMSGPLVKPGVVGKVVRYATSFNAGGASNAQADQAARAQQQSDRDRWVEESCHDIVQRASPGATLANRRVAMAKCVSDVKAKKPK